MGDFPCMTDAGLKHYRDDAAARAHYKEMADAIKDPLRSELLTMLRQHKSGEASTRYQQATGSDIRTACWWSMRYKIKSNRRRSLNRG